ncbi:MAG TPA: hypothetical protein VFA84_05995 [Acidimicrobiales bacterium]|nr:hypothetical protein [Acidimicrobiales bacterium]
MPEPGKPVFNHVAVSVPPDYLDEKGRREIVDFYSEVFGWEELDMLTLDRKRLVLGAYLLDQFVFIHADDEPMQAPKMDHFGMGVATEEELDTFLARAKAYQQRDPRVRIIDKHSDDYTRLSLVSFYVGYLLPLMVEVQFYKYN